MHYPPQATPFVHRPPSVGRAQLPLACSCSCRSLSSSGARCGPVRVRKPGATHLYQDLSVYAHGESRSGQKVANARQVDVCTVNSKEWFVAESWRGQHVGHDVWITQATYQRVSQSAHQLPIVCPASCPVATPLHNSVLRKQTWVALRYHAHVRYTRLHEIGSPVHVQITIHEIAQH